MGRQGVRVILSFKLNAPGLHHNKRELHLGYKIAVAISLCGETLAGVFSSSLFFSWVWPLLMDSRIYSGFGNYTQYPQ